LGGELPDTSQQPALVAGLLASPGPASELTESLVPEIADRLSVQLPELGGQWNSSPTGWLNRQPTSPCRPHGGP